MNNQQENSTVEARKRWAPYDKSRRGGVQKSTSVTKERPRSFSPQRHITEEDVRVFQEEVRPAYGVKPSEDDAQQRNLVRNEKKRLLCGSYLPLNNSASKLIHIGMDPYKDFAPVVRIVKSGIEAGVEFEEEAFKEFVNVLPEILVALREGSLNFDLQRYKMLCTGWQTCKFVPKTGTETFELYAMYSTLAKIVDMKDFLFVRLETLKRSAMKMSVLFTEFYTNVACIVENSGNFDVLDVLLSDTYKIDYRGEDVLGELIYNFKNFVITVIQGSVGSDDRLYIAGGVNR